MQEIRWHAVRMSEGLLYGKSALVLFGIDLVENVQLLRRGVHTISKLIEKQKAKQTDARMKLQALLEEKQTDDEKFKAKQEQLQRTKEWAQILDVATPPRKQMILAEIIDRVEVRRGYEITVKFKLTAQQFLDPNGCEAISKIAS